MTSPEPFGLALCRHFLDRNTRLDGCASPSPSTRGAASPTARASTARPSCGRAPRPGRRRSRAIATRPWSRPGLADLVILKSSRSAFSGYLRDEYTSLPETRDRILATSLSATWRYRDGEIAFGPAWWAVRGTLLETFAAHQSESVQHTMHAMGRAVMDGCGEVVRIHLVMPNRHHLPVDLAPFGLENRNEIFVATEEPHGLIEATLERD